MVNKSPFERSAFISALNHLRPGDAANDGSRLPAVAASTRFVLVDTSSDLRAQALTDGGTTSNAQNFSSNVSAILSGMVNQRHEVQQATDGGYEITDHGREVWQGIRRTSQWNARQATPIAS